MQSLVKFGTSNVRAGYESPTSKISRMGHIRWVYVRKKDGFRIFFFVVAKMIFFGLLFKMTFLGLSLVYNK